MRDWDYLGENFEGELGGELTFWRLAKWRMSEATNIDSENQCVINHKCLSKAMNRQFFQTVAIANVSCY